MPECFLSVLGLTASAAKDQRVEGVGKSSLCFRFVHPSQTEYAAYGEDHESVMSLADFRDAEVNKDHFVYFGKARRDYLPSGSDNLLPLTVHVVEQKEFVDDASYRPPVRSHSPRAVEANLSSHGEGTCYGWSTRSPKGKRRQALPSELESRGPEGYLFVLDPTSCAERRREEIELLDECLHRLPKKKPVAVVVSKCDLLSGKIRENMEGADFDLVQFLLEDSQTEKQSSVTPREKKLTKLHFQPTAGRMEIRWKKLVVPYFCASSHDGVGVDLPFLHLAHKVLRLSGSTPKSLPYLKLLKNFAALKESLKSAVEGLLKKHVKHEATTWAQTHRELLQDRAFEHYENIFGEKKAKELFYARLIEVVSLRAHLGPVETSAAEESLQPSTKSQLSEHLGKKHLLGGGIQCQDRNVDVSQLALQKFWAELAESHPDFITIARESSKLRNSIPAYCSVPLAGLRADSGVMAPTGAISNEHDKNHLHGNDFMVEPAFVHQVQGPAVLLLNRGCCTVGLNATEQEREDRLTVYRETSGFSHRKEDYDSSDDLFTCEEIASAKIAEKSSAIEMEEYFQQNKSVKGCSEFNDIAGVNSEVDSLTDADKVDVCVCHNASADHKNNHSGLHNVEPKPRWASKGSSYEEDCSAKQTPANSMSSASAVEAADCSEQRNHPKVVLEIVEDQYHKVDDQDICAVQRSPADADYLSGECLDEHLYEHITEKYVHFGARQVRTNSGYTEIRWNPQFNWQQQPPKREAHCGNIAGRNDAGEVQNSLKQSLSENATASLHRDIDYKTIALSAMQLPLLVQLELVTDLLQNIWHSVIDTNRKGKTDTHYLDILPPTKGFEQRPEPNASSKQGICTASQGQDFIDDLNDVTAGQPGDYTTADQVLEGVTTDFQPPDDVRASQLRDGVIDGQTQGGATTCQLQDDATTSRPLEDMTTGQAQDDITDSQPPEDVTTGQAQDDITDSQTQDQVSACQLLGDVAAAQPQNYIMDSQIQDHLTTSQCQGVIVQQPPVQEHVNPDQQQDDVAAELKLVAAASAAPMNSSQRQLDILAQLEVTTSLLEDLRTKLREDKEDARYLRLLNKCDTDRPDSSSAHG